MSLTETLKKIDEIKIKINEQKKSSPDLWPVIQDKLWIHWTYDSNAIEGQSTDQHAPHQRT